LPRWPVAERARHAPRPKNSPTRCCASVTGARAATGQNLALDGGLVKD